MKAVIADIEVHWGYSVREPLYTAAQPSYKLPPPTTMIGALAYPYSKMKNVPECIIRESSLFSSTISVSNFIRWVTVRNPLGPLGPIVTNDISRLSLVLGVRREHVYPGSRYLWGVQLVGKVYAPSTTLRTIYLVEDEYVRDFIEAVYSIVRIGSRESLANTKNVIVSEVNETKLRPIPTLYYFPLRLAREIRGAYFKEKFLSPRNEFYKLGVVRDVQRYMEEYIIPREPVDVDPSDIAKAIVIEKIKEYIVVPKEVLE